jgi:flagellar biosynthesis/type III secretory pathway protein FliH
MNTQTQETLKTIQEHIDLQMYGHAWDKCQELIEALEQPTMTYEQGFAHGYEAHKVEQELEHPQSDEYTEGYQQGYDDGWEAKKAEQPSQSEYMVNEGGTGTVLRKTAPSWQGLSDDEILEIDKSIKE